jgi:hypothetical protein
MGMDVGGAPRVVAPYKLAKTAGVYKDALVIACPARYTPVGK